MSWLEKLTEPTVLVPLVTGAAAGLVAAVRAVWLTIQQGRLDCLERCAGLTLDLQASRAEVKALQLELRETLKLSLTLQAKYDALCERDSRPPTS